MNNIKDKKVALVYDRVNKWGGAERVLLALHELFPKAPLYTAIYNSEKAAWAKVFEIRTSFLQKIPFASDHHEYLPLLMPFAFESFSFDEYDIVISVTSESAKGIMTKPGSLHICYCLTPTRYLWSGYDEYFLISSKAMSLDQVAFGEKETAKGKTMTAGRLATAFLKHMDKKTTNRVLLSNFIKKIT